MADDPKIKAKIEQWKQTAKVIERGQKSAKSLGDMAGAAPEAPPPRRLDCGYWAIMPTWTASEAAALSLGLNPREESQYKRDAYMDRLRLILRAVHAGEVDEQLAPDGWLEWLKSRGLGVPDALEKSIKARPTAQVTHRERQLEDQVKHLQKLLVEAQEKLNQSPSTQRLNNALLVAYVAAVKGYSWDPDAKRSDLIRQIMDDFAQLNINGPKEDALRSLFNEARKIAAERPLEGVVDEDYLP